MNVVVIGSPILGDAINKYGAAYNLNYVYRLDRINPFTLLNELNGKPAIPEDKNFEGVLIDAGSMSLEYHRFKMKNGDIYRVTSSQYNTEKMNIIKSKLESVSGKVLEEQLINAMSLSDEELEAEIKSYAEWMQNNFNGKRFIFCHIRNAKEYVTADNHVLMADAYKEIDIFNGFFERVYQMFLRYMSFEEIRMPDIFFADARQGENYGLWHCNDVYYEYVVKSICAILDGRSGSVEEYRKDCTQNTQKEIDIVLAKETAARFKEIINGRIPVLIGDSDLVKEAVFSVLGLNRLEYIDAGNLDGIGTAINALSKYNNREYAVILPKLYPKLGLLNALYVSGFEKDCDYTACKPEKRILKDFEGEYRDLYGNSIVSKCKQDFTINGGGNSVVVEKVRVSKFYLGNCADINIEEGIYKADNPAVIKMGDESKFVIGRNIFITANNVFDIGDFGTVIIGKDCMFATEVFLKCNRSDKPEKNIIRLGDHVWLGYRSVCLSGCDIETGSIVGARGVVSNAFPNNCIIAGDPAKLVKKDISWFSSLYENDINNIPQEYRKNTQMDMQ